jgi:hypothetical protein
MHLQTCICVMTNNIGHPTGHVDFFINFLFNPVHLKKTQVVYVITEL